VGVSKDLRRDFISRFFQAFIHVTTAATLDIDDHDDDDDDDDDDWLGSTWFRISHIIGRSCVKVKSHIWSAHAKKFVIKNFQHDSVLCVVLFVVTHYLLSLGHAMHIYSISHPHTKSFYYSLNIM